MADQLFNASDLSPATRARLIRTLNAERESIATSRTFARERADATRSAYLTGRGTRASADKWADKSAELGVDYYALADLITVLETADATADAV